MTSIITLSTYNHIRAKMRYEDPSPLDEYTLAAFLSGTLSEEEHRKVLVFLADNEEACELICMAQDALEAAREPVTEPFTLPEIHVLKSATPGRPALSLVHWQRYAIAAMVLIMLTFGLRTILSDNTDTLRGGDDATTLAVQVDAQTLEMSWNALPDAYSYRVVVWDVAAAENVAREEIRTPHLYKTDPFVQQLHDQLEDGNEYEVRIDVLDDENRVIQRADLLSFTYHP